MTQNIHILAKLSKVLVGHSPNLNNIIFRISRPQKRNEFLFPYYISVTSALSYFFLYFAS